MTASSQRYSRALCDGALLGTYGASHYHTYLWRADSSSIIPYENLTDACAKQLIPRFQQHLVGKERTKLPRDNIDCAYWFKLWARSADLYLWKIKLLALIWLKKIAFCEEAEHILGAKDKPSITDITFWFLADGIELWTQSCVLTPLLWVSAEIPARRPEDPIICASCPRIYVLDW